MLWIFCYEALPAAVHKKRASSRPTGKKRVAGTLHDQSSLPSFKKF